MKLRERRVFDKYIICVCNGFLCAREFAAIAHICVCLCLSLAK